MIEGVRNYPQEDPGVSGCFLLVFDPDGRRVCLGSRDVDVEEFAGGPRLHFSAGIVGDVEWNESADIYGNRGGVSEYELDVMDEQIGYIELRRTGAVVQGLRADLYWHVAGVGQRLDQSVLVATGRVQAPTFDEEKGVLHFRITDPRVEKAEAFPPLVATDDRLDSLEDESAGKEYPVVVGAAKKCPAIKFGSSYLICQDKLGEMTGSPVTEMYDGDTALGIGSQQADKDNEGNNIWTAVPDDGAGSKDVTADVTGHTPADIEGAISYLFRFFCGEEDIYDRCSLKALRRAFAGVTIGAVFNERRVTSAYEAVVQRLEGQLPFATVWRGGKFVFTPLTWGGEARHHLTTDRNILRRISGPTETPVDKICSEYTVNWGRSGLRGDYAGSIVRDPTCSRACWTARRRYGPRAYPDFDAGDVADIVSAGLVAEWLVETFSKMRLMLEYECSMDCAGLELWDTVRVYDENEEWGYDRAAQAGGVLFKVCGVSRRDGATVGVSLVSIDDYLDIYGG